MDDKERAAELARRSIELHHAGDLPGADQALDESLALAPSVHLSQAPAYDFKRTDWTTDVDQRVVNLNNYARDPRASDKQVFPNYYSLGFGPTHEQSGLRVPEDRLQYLRSQLLTIPWHNGVIDLGGNQGGMLFALRHEIRWGVGTDYDYRLINAANAMAVELKTPFINFYVHDLDEDNLEIVMDFMPESKAGIVFLLAVCPHIKRWREVIQLAPKLSTKLLFESNGHEYEQLGQYRELLHNYEVVTLLADRGAPGIGARRLYYCSNPI